MTSHENKDYSINRRGVGFPNATSEGSGAEGQGRTTTGNIEKRNTTGADVQHGDNSAGKILGRLELLEKAFYSYVHGHQDRLKTRYKESTELEAAFTEELHVIKRGLRELAQQTEDDPE